MSPRPLELGLYTDSLAHLGFEDALDVAARIGATGIEIATGGQSSAPHLRIDELLGDAGKRAAFAAAFESRGLRIAALNCSAWPLHPVVSDEHVALIRSTIRLAAELGVRKIVTMSGSPGDGPGSSTVNFTWYPWPADAMALLDRQWTAAIDLWHGLGTDARAAGIDQLAFELHPLHLVYNVPTLERMRAAVGPIIGANLDPSHLFWQQMDPLAVVQALGPAVYHVHLKDTELVPEQVALAGVLDQRPFDDPSQRGWVFRTVGSVHGVEFWSAFVAALREVGYDDVLAIENEDAGLPPEAAVEEAARFMHPILDA
ncbi:MAG TPA: sugar phosphate isomerase/epimerase [Candidatus Limnocylindrales bacterium]|nr:sugar phosphate isomerase/epimerase [Candidatus Limnocylindrales bacterium]